MRRAPWAHDSRPGQSTKPAVLSYDELPELVTPEEAQAFLRISRNTCYDLLRTGAIPSIKFGRLIRINKAVLRG